MEVLPDDIILKIFSYCSSSLKKLCVVCKRFESIVTTNSELMLKLPLVLKSNSNEEKYKSIIRSRRRYCAVIIRYDYNFSDNGMKILMKFGRSIKSLEIIRCLFTFAKISKIFEMLPNLETFKISATFLQMEMMDDCQPTIKSITSLKKFDFRFGDDKIFNFLSSSKIKHINISLSNPSSKRFEQFFVNQKHLQIIEGSIYFTNEILSCFPNLSFLNEVTVEMDQFLSFVFTNPNSITSVSTRKLNIYDTTEDQQVFINILNIFPNLKTLAVIGNQKLSLKNVPNKFLTKLTIFDCKFSSDFNFKSIQIPTIESFEFDKIETLEDWECFSKNHPNIYELILKPNTVEIQDFDYTFQEAESRLKYLNINLISKENFKFLLSKSNFASLKILRLLVSNIQRLVDSMREEIVQSGILVYYRR